MSSNKFYRKKLTRITNSKVYDQIHKRLGLPKDIIVKVINTYVEVVKECILSDVEVEIENLGVFYLMETKPQYGVVRYNPLKREYCEPKDIPSKRKIELNWEKEWAKELTKKLKENNDE